jgi:hypothetical protein
MCDRRHDRSLAAVPRTSRLHLHRLVFRVPTTDDRTAVASVRVWALVPSDTPPDVVARVERAMQIAYHAACAEIAASEGQR